VIPQLALVGLLAQAPIEQNHSFGVVVEAAAELGLDEAFLDAGEPAPRPGFLLTRNQLARLLGDVSTAPSRCEARLRDQGASYEEKLQASARRCEERLAPLVTRIDELQQIEDQLQEDLITERDRLWWWKVGTLGGAAAIVTTFTLILVME
jgi:phytoene dehydrogenase-like protein